MKRHRLPAILSDIDGVLYRGGKPIAGSSWATKRLIKPFTLPSSHETVKLPFSLLTNGGGDTEQDRADLVNRKMFGCEEKLHLSVDEMICCHTPLKRMVP